MIVNNLSHDTEQVLPDPKGLWKPMGRYAYSYTEMFPDPFQLANLEITTNNRTTLPGKWVLREYITSALIQAEMAKKLMSK